MIKKNFLIITRHEHIPINALYVIAELLIRGQNVVVLRQLDRIDRGWKGFRRRWKYYRRLLKKRGAFTFIDNILSNLPYLASFVRKVFMRTEGVHENMEEIVFGGNLRLNIEDYKARTVWQDVADVNVAESEEFVRQVAPNVIVLAGAPIVRKNIFKLAKDIAINMHLGITPKYQGCNPFIWAIANRDFDNIGFTIHHVAPKVDSGTIILQRKIDWDPRWSFQRLDYELIYAMSRGTLEVIDRYLNGGDLNKDNFQNIKNAQTLQPAGLLTFMRAYRAKKSYAQHANS